MISPIPVTDAAKQRAKCIFNGFLISFGAILVVMSVLVGLGAHYADGTSGYWAGGIGVMVMSTCVIMLCFPLVDKAETYDTDIVLMKPFVDGFNFLGMILLVGLASCFVGIGIGAGIGAKYGLSDDNNSAIIDNTTDIGNSTDVYKEDNFVNVKENRTIGILMAVFSGMSVLIMVRFLMYHDEVRNGLGIPNNSINLQVKHPTQTQTPQTEPETSQTQPETLQTEPETVQPELTQTQPDTPDTQPEVPETLPATPETQPEVLLTVPTRESQLETLQSQPQSAEPGLQPQPSGSNKNKKNSKRELKLLKAQNKLLTEQNALQKQRLEQMTELNRNLQRMSENASGLSEEPAPPSYQTLFVALPPEYGSKTEDESKF